VCPRYGVPASYFVRTTGLDQQMVEEYIRRQIEDDQQNDGNPQMEFQW
jgi:hypothetical protein